MKRSFLSHVYTIHDEVSLYKVSTLSLVHGTRFLTILQIHYFNYSHSRTHVASSLNRSSVPLRGIGREGYQAQLTRSEPNPRLGEEGMRHHIK